jgi:hypothetical protein
MTSLKPRKKVQTHIISFDDDEIENELPSSSVSLSAPQTSLNSSSTTLAKDISPAPYLPSSRSQTRSVTNDVVLDVKPMNWDERYGISPVYSTVLHLFQISL